MRARSRLYEKSLWTSIESMLRSSRSGRRKFAGRRNGSTTSGDIALEVFGRRRRRSVRKRPLLLRPEPVHRFLESLGRRRVRYHK
jgi:hypothetical protein